MSDWSSDVCSSDLEVGRDPRERLGRKDAEGAEDDRRYAAEDQDVRTESRRAGVPGEQHREAQDRIDPDRRRDRDRKSVVEGKRVAGRVALGGSRSIKKQKRKVEREDEVKKK